MMIEAIPNLPKESTDSAKICRAYYYDSQDAKAGMVLIDPAYSDTKMISSWDGSIVACTLGHGSR